MLKEFLKYAKMASHMFDVSRASNYDTANINDPYLVFKKMIQLAKARKTIISSVDDIISGSFIKELKDKIFDYRDAFSEILMSDYGNVRNVLQDVLEPYTELSDRDFVKLSQKAVNDLFDWAVQTTARTGVPLNTKVARILLGTETEKSAAEQIVDYKDSILGNPAKGIQPKPDHPLFNNIILRSLSIDQDDRNGGKKGKVINLKIDGRDNKVADQNLTIYGFNELREVLRSEQNLKLYGRFTRLALLQSGLTNSPISFTNLLPYEDFKGLYNETLSILEKLPNLAEFKNLNVLERNNWNNSDVAKYKRPSLYFGKKPDGTTFVSNLDIDTLIKPLKTAVRNNVIPKLVGLSPMSEAGRSDFIVYSYEDYISNEKRILRRKTGNTDHQHKMLMQKVYTLNENNKRVPLMHITEKNGVIYKKYVYKAINAWGDSFRAQEFYTTGQQSVLDNGFDKVNEVEDDVIVNIYNGGPTATAAPTVSDEKINIYAGTGENAELSNFAIRPFVPNATKAILGESATIKFNTVEGAFQAAKALYTNNLSKEDNDFNKSIVGRLQTATGAEAKSLGQQIKGLNSSEWDKVSSNIMKDLISASFEQNPNALNNLLATGNAELTHTQDTGKWGKEFPRLLMEVREELSPAVSEKSEGVTLKDGNTYTADQLNTKMLSAMGYNLIEAGDIIKNNKC